MKRGSLMLAVLAVFALASAWPARTDALTFDLNCIIGNSLCASSASYGTVSLTPNTSGANTSVDIKIDLVGPGTGAPDSGQKVLFVFLNFNDGLFSNADTFQLASGATVKVGVNDERFPPFQTGHSGGFDLQLGNVNAFEPYLDTLSVAGKNLLPEHLGFKDSTGTLFAGVHIGNCSKNSGSPNVCDPGVTGNGSIKVGSTNELTPVSEPATLLLLGASMAGVGMLKGRFRRKPAR